MADDKLLWPGAVVAVQPRIRLTRSFDQRYHTYLGYTLRLQVQIGDDEREFLVGIGEAAQAKHQFRVGDRVSGRSEPVANPDSACSKALRRNSGWVSPVFQAIRATRRFIQCQPIAIRP
jgi:hypothetical protein